MTNVAIVVYLLIPTSNHNKMVARNMFLALYIFWFLHQTTTVVLYYPSTEVLYIFWFLHQTTTYAAWIIKNTALYIFWFLHQTTTYRATNRLHVSCISFDSYIKPQQRLAPAWCNPVVYLLIPTSNHNSLAVWCLNVSVVYLLIPTSNHNVIEYETREMELYIFWFLHQTTTHWLQGKADHSCISFDSYIKPQPVGSAIANIFGCISFDSYIKPQLIHCRSLVETRCISFDSYIKPQLYDVLWWLLTVVYLLIPTSNHNIDGQSEVAIQLYIFWFLHQTTTISNNLYNQALLYIFWFLHQTTTVTTATKASLSCISFDSYIKPQPIEYNMLIHNIYQSLLLIRNGVQDIISNAKVLKKLQLNRFADNFFRYFTLINTFGFTPEVIDISILLICYT